MTAQGPWVFGTLLHELVVVTLWTPKHRHNPCVDHKQARGPNTPCNVSLCRGLLQTAPVRLG